MTAVGRRRSEAVLLISRAQYRPAATGRACAHKCPVTEPKPSTTGRDCRAASWPPSLAGDHVHPRYPNCRCALELPVRNCGGRGIPGIIVGSCRLASTTQQDLPVRVQHQRRRRETRRTMICACRNVRTSNCRIEQRIAWPACCKGRSSHVRDYSQVDATELISADSSERCDVK